MKELKSLKEKPERLQYFVIQIDMTTLNRAFLAEVIQRVKKIMRQLCQDGQLKGKYYKTERLPISVTEQR